MAAISGQKTVTTAGTAVALGGAVAINGTLMIKALDTNTGVVAVGNDGSDDVTLSNGMRLSASEGIVMEFVARLDQVYLDAAVNGEGVCWMALAVR